MQFYAAWPVECHAQDFEILKRGPGNVPVIIWRPVEAGSVVVIGDTHLASNDNLESARSIHGENLYFWRWLLSRATDRAEWIPPNPSAQPDEEAAP